MSRDFYEGIVGATDPVDDKFVVYEGIEVWVFPRGTANLDNFTTLSSEVADIFQRSTGGSSGPSPESGATSGPNPFVTGTSGSIQFWADQAENYDIILHDLELPQRSSDVIKYFNAIDGMDILQETDTRIEVIDDKVDGLQKPGIFRVQFRSSGSPVSTPQNTAVLFTYINEPLEPHYVFDLSNWYNPSNGRYKPEIEGYYRLSCSINIAAAAGSILNVAAAIRKNGGAAYPGSIITVGSVITSGNSVATNVFYADGVSDYFDVVIFGKTVDLNLGSSFCGELISRA